MKEPVIPLEVQAEWKNKARLFEIDLQELLNTGLPQLHSISDFEQKSREHEARHIWLLNDLVLSKSQGDDLITQKETQTLILSLITTKIEGSHLNLKDLVRLNVEYLKSICPDLVLEDSIVDKLINDNSQRKPYGVKLRNALTLYDQNPLTLWCWEVDEIGMLAPYTQM